MRAAGVQGRRQVSDLEQRPTALYRAYNSDGVLLYVGIAVDWGARWAQHRATAPYYNAVARLEIEWLPTRAAAKIAEREAVEKEQPLHNIEHTAKDQRPWAKGNAERTELYARSFDHLNHRRLPEYLAAYKAIDALANSGIGLSSQEALVQLLAEMARSVPYGDSCRRCRDAGAEEWWNDPAFPLAVDVRGTYIDAVYAHDCGHSWRTTWAIDAPLYGP